MSVVPLNQMYAVTVRDEELFVVLTVRRKSESDVYVHLPRNGAAGSSFHASYHASGQFHHKSFGRTRPSKALLLKHRQRPTPAFQGNENIMQTSLAADLARNVGIICRPEEFKRVFEIPVSDIAAEPFCTQLSVDLTAPTPLPFSPPMCGGAAIVRQVVFDDTVPWIEVTLFKAAT